MHLFKDSWHRVYLSASEAIITTRFSLPYTDYSCIYIFKCPHKKKSRGVYSGEFKEQATALRHFTHHLGSVAFNKYRTQLKNCAGVPPCMKHM